MISKEQQKKIARHINALGGSLEPVTKILNSCIGRDLNIYTYISHADESKDQIVVSITNLDDPYVDAVSLARFKPSEIMSVSADDIRKLVIEYLNKAIANHTKAKEELIKNNTI